MSATKNFQKGAMFIYIMLFIAVFMMLMIPVTAIFIGKLQLMRSAIIREKAFQIAEAGINYYQWHFAQYPDDFEDCPTGGLDCEDQPNELDPETTVGPFVHDYIDYDTQQTIGQFELYVTTPPLGATIRTIQSTGWLLSNPGIKKTVSAKFAVTAASQYAVLTASPTVIPTPIIGQIRSLSGIRNNVSEVSNNIISEVSSYTCRIQDQLPCPVSMPGVWGPSGAINWASPPSWAQFVQYPPSHMSLTQSWPATTNWTTLINDSLFSNLQGLAYTDNTCYALNTATANCANYFDYLFNVINIAVPPVVGDGYRIGTVNYTIYETNLVLNGSTYSGTISMRGSANPGSIPGSSGWLYKLPSGTNIQYTSYTAPYNGLNLVFNANGTYDLYVVKPEANPVPGYYWEGSIMRHNEATDYDVSSRYNIPCSSNCTGSSFNLPPNGVIFTPSDLFIEGTLNGRVTVAAAKLPYSYAYSSNGIMLRTSPSVYITDNLVYATKDESCALGLFSQKYIFVSYGAPDNVEINGFFVTQYNSMGYMNYLENDHDRGAINTYGSIMNKGENNFGYCYPCHGYTDWNFNYDNSLFYAPPPGAPAPNTIYQLIFWSGG